MRITDKAFIIGFPVFMLFTSTGIQNYFHFKNPTHHRQIQIHTQGLYGSNTVNTAFVQSFLTGSYIDNSMKASVSDYLMKSNNTVGFDWNTEISFTNYNDTLLGKEWGYHLSMSNRMYADVSFNKDLFDLVFYGNQRFAGTQIDLAPAYAELVMYQQFKMGFIKSFNSPSDKHKFGFAISFLNGNNRMMMNSTRMNMLTDSAANYVDISGNVSLAQTNPDYSYFLSNNGSGVALDVGYDGFLGDRHHVHFGLTDLGFIAWTRPANFANIDSSIHFTGVQINNIVTATGEEFNQFADSISSQYITTKREPMGTMMLPMSLQLNYTYTVKAEKIYLTAGVQTKMLKSYLPLVYARGTFYPHKNIVLSVMAGYGGFSKLNLGFDVGVEFARGYSLLVYTRNAEGMIPNTFGTAISAGFRFNKTF